MQCNFDLTVPLMNYSEAVRCAISEMHQKTSNLVTNSY